MNWCDKFKGNFFIVCFRGHLHLSFFSCSSIYCVFSEHSGWSKNMWFQVKRKNERRVVSFIWNRVQHTCHSTNCSLYRRWLVWRTRINAFQCKIHTHLQHIHRGTGKNLELIKPSTCNARWTYEISRIAPRWLAKGSVEHHPKMPMLKYGTQSNSNHKKAVVMFDILRILISRSHKKTNVNARIFSVVTWILI